MTRINRESPADAQRIIDEFIVDEANKREILSFLSEAISFANSLNSENWNLNLDKNGKFVRFNVGQVYCIEIFSGYISILTLKEYVRKRLAETRLNIEFKGYNRIGKILSFKLDDVPDCLIKVPNSVACHVKNHSVVSVLPCLKEANREFISHAIKNTTRLPKMIRAHSTGFISYLSEYINKEKPPVRQIDYADEIDETKTYTEGTTKQVKVNIYERNAEARAICIKKYGASCSVCGFDFGKKFGKIGTGFIHVHHLKPLSEIRKGYELNPIEDLRPVCPNCHAMIHQGKPEPYTIEELKAILKRTVV